MALQLYASVLTRITPEQAEKLQAEAVARGMSPSGLTAEVIRAWIDNLPTEHKLRRAK